MEFRAWATDYRRIRQEFGFSLREDEQARDVLLGLLRDHRHARLGEEADRSLRARLHGRSVLVVGGGPGPGPFPLPLRLVGNGPWTVLAADGAARTCLRGGHRPDLVVTDLDGDMPHEIEANRRGALLVVHAHGDNIGALRRWVPRLPGPVVGTCAAAPLGGLLNPGGFTDGDRALFLAEAYGARRALLGRFDLGRPFHEPVASFATKGRKLRTAERLLLELARRGRLPVEVLTWGNGGPPRVDPFGGPRPRTSFGAPAPPRLPPSRGGR